MVQPVSLITHLLVRLWEWEIHKEHLHLPEKNQKGMQRMEVNLSSSNRIDLPVE